LDDVEAWLEAGEDDPGFQILTEEKIVASVTEEAESSEDEEEEVGDTTQPTIKVSEVKDHLHFVIQYVEQSANENVFAYYEHLWHLHQLLTEEISSKQTQQKINYFFKPMNISNQHEPGPSCSKD
jgi:helix-turn-helix protein